MPTPSWPHFGEICALLTALIWAFAVIFFRVGGRQLAPLALNLFKNTFALVLFVPTAWLLGVHLLPPLSGRDWLLLAASGVVGLTVGDTLFFASLNRLGAGLSAVIDCLYSPLVVLFSFFLLGERLTAGHLIGGGLIVSAVFLPSANPLESGLPRRTFWSGMVLGALAMAAMALGLVLAKPVLDRSQDLTMVIAARLALGTLPLYVYAWRREGRRQLALAFRPSPLWKSTWPGAFLGAYLAMIFWLVGTKYTLAGIAAILNQLSAVLIILLGRLFLKEPLTWRKLVAVLLGIFGATIIFFS